MLLCDRRGENPSGYYRILFTQFEEDAFIDQHKSLSMITFVRPGPSWRCSLESLAVKNGLVMNDGNVPYFLEGATVTIRCNEGYQVKGLVNYTIYQDVTCFKDIIPKPCVMLKNAEKSGMSQDISLYLSLIVLLCIILIFCSLNQPWSSLCGFFSNKVTILSLADTDSIVVAQNVGIEMKKDDTKDGGERI